MSMQVGGKKGGPMADINVTPMADVMIVLLIIFMVVTPLLQKGVDVKLPTAAQTEEKEDKQQIINVAVKNDAVRTTYIGTRKLDNQEELTKEVRARLVDAPENARIVYLKADTNLPYSEVMKVMDMLREAGVEEIALIAEKKVRG